MTYSIHLNEQDLRTIITNAVMEAGPGLLPSTFKRTNDRRNVRVTWADRHPMPAYKGADIAATVTYEEPK